MTRTMRWSRIIPLVLVAACSSLTEVQAPDVVLPDKVANAAGARLLYYGAIGDLPPVFAYWGIYFAMTDEAMLGFTDKTDSRGYSSVLQPPYSDWVGGYVSYYAQHSRVESLQAITAMQKYLNESTGPTRAQVGR